LYLNGNAVFNGSIFINMIKLDVIASNFKMKYIKNTIERTLAGNLIKKMTIYSNDTKHVETIREETDAWFDSEAE
jgi:adenylosuccinate synthase